MYLGGFPFRVSLDLVSLGSSSLDFQFSFVWALGLYFSTLEMLTFKKMDVLSW